MTFGDAGAVIVEVGDHLAGLNHVIEAVPAVLCMDGPVEAVFEPVTEEVTLVYWRPVVDRTSSAPS